MQRDSSANLSTYPSTPFKDTEGVLDPACDSALDSALDSAFERGCSPDACTMMFSMEMTTQ